MALTSTFYVHLIFPEISVADPGVTLRGQAYYNCVVQKLRKFGVWDIKIQRSMAVWTYINIQIMKIYKGEITLRII